MREFGFLEKYHGLLMMVGAILATAVTITAYALTNFSSKLETKEALEGTIKVQNQLMEKIEKRLDRIEDKIDYLSH
jgi:hypothetical protein